MRIPKERPNQHFLALASSLQHFQCKSIDACFWKIYNYQKHYVIFSIQLLIVLACDSVSKNMCLNSLAGSIMLTRFAINFFKMRAAYFSLQNYFFEFTAKFFIWWLEPAHILHNHEQVSIEYFTLRDCGNGLDTGSRSCWLIIFFHATLLSENGKYYSRSLLRVH